MITVHHLNNSRSQRVLWLLEELGLAYEVVRYQRRPDMLAPPELKKVHPLGKSPVITEDGRTIAETGAINDYHLERHGQARLVPPAGSQENTRFSYWLHSDRKNEREGKMVSVDRCSGGCQDIETNK